MEGDKTLKSNHAYEFSRENGLVRYLHINIEVGGKLNGGGDTQVGIP